MLVVVMMTDFASQHKTKSVRLEWEWSTLRGSVSLHICDGDGITSYFRIRRTAQNNKEILMHQQTKETVFKFTIVAAVVFASRKTAFIITAAELLFIQYLNGYGTIVYSRALQTVRILYPYIPCSTVQQYSSYDQWTPQYIYCTVSGSTGTTANISISGVISDRSSSLVAATVATCL